jgi:hypothetical protein
MPESSPENAKGKEKEKVEALKAFDFGQLIAFVLPGLVATRALALLMPSLAAAFEKITAPGEGAFGPLVWLLLVGSTVGLTISVTRQQWLDPVFGWIYGCFPIRENSKTKERPRGPWRVNYSVITRDEKMQAWYEKAVREVYRYYQFIANIGIALAIGAGALWRAASLGQSHLTPDSPPFALLRWVATGLSLFLLFTAYQQFKGWCRVHNQITSSVESKGSSNTATKQANTAAEQANPAAAAPDAGSREEGKADTEPKPKAGTRP